MKDDEKKWLIIKLLIVIIPGIFYWTMTDDFFEKKVSFNVAVDAGVSSKKSDEKTLPAVQNSQNNLDLAEKKFEEGFAADNKGDYLTAINLYTQTLELNPNYARAYHNRGLDYQRTQNFGLALEDLNKAIPLEPDSAFMYNSRGTIYRSLKNFNQAISDYDKAIQLDSNYSEAYSNRALAHVELKNYTQAISDCNAALQLNPNQADAYLFRAISYGCLLNFNQGIADANMAIQLSEKLSPGNLAVAHQVRGVCYQQAGDSEKSQADFAQAKILGYKGN